MAKYIETPVGIEGTKVTLGDKIYLVPALSLRAMRLHKDTLSMLQRGRDGNEELTDEYLTAVEQVIHAAIHRNYPDVTLEEVAENVDMRNMWTVILAVMGVSGFTNEAAQSSQAEVVTDPNAPPAGTVGVGE